MTNIVKNPTGNIPYQMVHLLNINFECLVTGGENFYHIYRYTSPCSFSPSARVYLYTCHLGGYISDHVI
jgi:hypothetical protein